MHDLDIEMVAIMIGWIAVYDRHGDINHIYISDVSHYRRIIIDLDRTMFLGICGNLI